MVHTHWKLYQLVVMRTENYIYQLGNKTEASRLDPTLQYITEINWSGSWWRYTELIWKGIMMGTKVNFGDFYWPNLDIPVRSVRSTWTTANSSQPIQKTSNDDGIHEVQMFSSHKLSNIQTIPNSWVCVTGCRYHNDNTSLYFQDFLILFGPEISQQPFLQ